MNATEHKYLTTSFICNYSNVHYQKRNYIELRYAVVLSKIWHGTFKQIQYLTLLLYLEKKHLYS